MQNDLPYRLTNGTTSFHKLTTSLDGLSVLSKGRNRCYGVANDHGPSPQPTFDCNWKYLSPLIALVGFVFPYIFKKWAIPGPSFSFIFVPFQINIRNFYNIIVKNVHPVYGAGIPTDDLRYMSHLPSPQDQGSSPSFPYFILCSHTKALPWDDIRI